LLGWGFAVLLSPERFGDATYPPPDWLCADERRWLRYTLAALAGAGIAALAVPFVGVLGSALHSARSLAVGIVGVILIGWGYVRAVDPPEPASAGRLDGLLPVRGRWVAYFLIAAGFFVLAANWVLPDG
jgi:hypothetical protein